MLWANKEVEPQIITEISDAFVKNEGIFLKQQNLSFSILPLAIELYDLTKQKVFLDFVEGSVNMLASKKVPSSDLKKIVSIRNNQSAIINTAMLIQASVPDRGWYNFEEMERIARLINLTDVCPMIVDFIKQQVIEIGRKVSFRKRIPAGLESELKRIEKFS